MIVLGYVPDNSVDLDTSLEMPEGIYPQSQERDRCADYYARYLYSFGNKGLGKRSLASFDHVYPFEIPANAARELDTLPCFARRLRCVTET